MKSSGAHELPKAEILADFNLVVARQTHELTKAEILVGFNLVVARQTTKPPNFPSIQYIY